MTTQTVEARQVLITGASRGIGRGLGFNDSSIHVDIVSPTDRTVTATLRDGSTLPIYARGRFLTSQRPGSLTVATDTTR